jgi:hypothetical protein
MSTALGVEHGQLALYIFTSALVASDRLIGFVEGAQDFVFFLAVEANVFVDGHRNLPRLLYITARSMDIVDCHIF